MAQAFSSFDTYLAPFVKIDNLTYKQTKQCIQSFVFGVNTPSRWGCVPIDTKILTPDGWKGPDELNVGDKIFTWIDGVMKEAPLKHIIRRKNTFGVLHQYKGLDYVQTVTPEHRCIIANGDDYIINRSMDIFDKVENVQMPVYNDEHREVVMITERNEIPYDGEVWCPNTDDGTAIYKDADGNIFISGNCQAPFSNITLDWTVPADMKGLPAIVGGEEMDFTYGDCQKEMDMVNKAFIEVMIEGDSEGRGFSYPMNYVA